MLQPTEIRHHSRVYKGHIPFIRFLLALGAGIAAGSVITPQYALYVAAWTVLAISLAAFVTLSCFTRFRRYPYSGVVGFFFLLMLAAAGWVRLWEPHPAMDATHFSRMDTQSLVGYVADEPVVRGSHVRLVLAVTHRYEAEILARCSGNLMLTINMGDSLARSPFTYGDELVIPPAYEEIPPPYNPGETDYKRYLAGKNIWHQAYIELREVHKAATGRGNPVVAYALNLRQQMVAKFAHHLSDSDAFSVASTLILGYRATLDQSILDSFSATGTIHVLSVSGMHVVIVYWLLSKLLWWMNRGRPRRMIRFMLLLTAIWGYALLTGFSPSVLRASLMMSFVLVATNFGRQHQLYNSIAASAFFLLWLDPKFIVDIGFQLSYLAVLGMVFLIPKLQAALPVRNVYARPISDYVWMSVGAQAGAGPLAAYYFHQFPLYFLPANLLIILPASAAMYLGFALLLLPYGIWSIWIGQLLERLILLMNGILGSIEQWPMARISGIWTTWWESVLVYLVLIALVLAFSRQEKRLLYGALAGLLLLGFSSFLKECANINRHQVVVFNVGRHLALGLIGAGEAWIYSDLPASDHRTIQYRVMPALESSVPAGRIHFIPQHSAYWDEAVYTRSNVLQFGDKRVLVYEAGCDYGRQLEVDILLLRNNPRVGLDELLERFSFRQLILDGSNYDATIEQFRKEAHTAGIPVYVLKRNFAYVWPTEV